MTFGNNNYNLIKMKKNVNSKNINKQTIFGIFTNTWSVIKRSKITKDKRIGIYFTKPPPHANKCH